MTLGASVRPTPSCSTTRPSDHARRHVAAVEDGAVDQRESTAVLLPPVPQQDQQVEDADRAVTVHGKVLDLLEALVLPGAMASIVARGGRVVRQCGVD